MTMYKLDRAELLKLGISRPTVDALARLSDTFPDQSSTIALIAAELSALRVGVNSLKMDIRNRLENLEAPPRRIEPCDCKGLQSQIDEIRNKIGC